MAFATDPARMRDAHFEAYARRALETAFADKNDLSVSSSRALLMGPMTITASFGDVVLEIRRSDETYHDHPGAIAIHRVGAERRDRTAHNVLPLAALQDPEGLSEAVRWIEDNVVHAKGAPAMVVRAWPEDPDTTCVGVWRPTGWSTWPSTDGSPRLRSDTASVARIDLVFSPRLSEADRTLATEAVLEIAARYDPSTDDRIPEEMIAMVFSTESGRSADVVVLPRPGADEETRSFVALNRRLLETISAARDVRRFDPPRPL